MKTETASAQFNVNGCECRMLDDRELHSLAIIKSIAHLCLELHPINEIGQELFPLSRNLVQIYEDIILIYCNSVIYGKTFF